LFQGENSTPTGWLDKPPELQFATVFLSFNLVYPFSFYNTYDHID